MLYNDLWKALSEAGMEVHTREGGIRVTNASALTPEIRDGLREHREAIMAELRMPFVDYVLFVFGGVETDAAGKPRKTQPGQNVGLGL